MPNRILRDWTSSETVDLLSLEAEVFFTRLIMRADDYGSFYGNPKLIRAALFPLREYTDKQVMKWRDECVKAQVVTLYTVGDREYIKILNFGQRLRQMVSKFPPLPADWQQVAVNPPSIVDNSPPETKRREVETESEEEGETNTKENADKPLVCVWPTFDDWWELYDKKVDRNKCEKKFKKISQGAREKMMRHTEDYVKSTPDIQYRRNPTTYLNNCSWENEIVITNGRQTTAQAAVNSIAASIERTLNGSNGP